ncbi:threonine-phosphate decarboxylase CobD [Henriciella sp.]|uniref:threonine-phosphate decarboxylase CobD n=1 Tax=Henriciella sp. TaxID=1968823 RepID=UPI00261865F9|nr:threonine-phosphate decarboxylase CobD [Henriciella sp.]
MKDDLLHGGALDRMRAHFPDAPAPWLDLSTGINPWPCPVDPIPAEAFEHLPTQAAYHACHTAMAHAFNAPQDHLLIAPGSELLIRLLPTIIAPRRVATLSPSYGDHARVWRAAGCELIETADPLDTADEADAIVLCQPNNPDGRTFALDDLLAACDRLAVRGGWLIVDEAYADLDPALSLASRTGRDGLIVLRSFGKFFGLAGLRLGALLAPTAILTGMQEKLGVWPVNGPALDVGARCYGDLAWQAETRARLAAARQRLDIILENAGLALAGGTDLFRFIETEDATGLWEKLARAGIYVRRFDWSARHLRIGLPPDADAEARLAAALSP